MSQREAVIRDIYRLLFETGDLDQADRLVTDDCVDHASPQPGGRGPEGVKATVRFLHSALADIRYEIEDILFDGDRSAFRATMSGTHVGELFGLPPTGKRFSQQQVHILRFEGDRVAEHWACRDDLGAMLRLREA